MTRLIDLNDDGIRALLSVRAARGAMLLEKADPGWHRRIDLDRLAMETCGRCILGQLYGSYQRGFRRILRGEPSTRLFIASEYGFTLSEPDQIDLLDRGGLRRHEGVFGFLADAWRRGIAGRLEMEATGGPL